MFPAQKFISLKIEFLFSVQYSKNSHAKFHIDIKNEGILFDPLINSVSESFVSYINIFSENL